MGVLNTSIESFEIPDWVLVHPELEVQLNSINTPVFTIWYSITTTDGNNYMHNKVFSIVEIIKDYEPGNPHQIIQENIIAIGDYIVNTIHNIYAKNVKIKFIDHVHIGIR